MNMQKIEKVYEMNGLSNYKVNTTDDLIKCHNVDYTKVKGFNNLTLDNKENFKSFIVNFFNVLGLESRTKLVPLSIYYIEQMDFLAKENQTDDYYIITGGEITILNVDGSKRLLRKWKDEDYKDLEVLKKESKKYLRFEYEYYNRKEWLHVIKEGKEWY